MPTQDGRPDLDDLENLGAALSARAALREAAGGADLLAVVGATHRAGWLRRAGTGTTVAELAALDGVAADRVRRVLDVLRAGGVLEVDADLVRTTPSWTALVAGASGVSLDVVLAALDLEVAALQTVTSFDPVPAPATAMTLARDWGVRPTAGARSLYGVVYDHVPEFAAALRAGGPFLDVGSGVGGALLATASVFPDLHAVGVERAPDVAAELRRHAEEAGVSDRVAVRAVDALDLEDEDRFAAAYWAQEFFDPTARARVLAVVHRALRSGGLLLLQELLPPTTDGGVSPRRAADVLFGDVVGASFGASAEELAAEGTVAGFDHVATTATPAGRLVLLRRPQASGA